MLSSVTSLTTSCSNSNIIVVTIHHRSRPTRAASLISLRNSPRPLYVTQMCLYQKRKEEAAELVAEEFVISDLCQNRRRLSEIILIYSVFTPHVRKNADFPDEWAQLRDMSVKRSISRITNLRHPQRHIYILQNHQTVFLFPSGKSR